MQWYDEYKLVKDGDGYTLEIYLNKNDAEFSKEFFSNIKENAVKLDERIKKLVDEKFAGLKINSVKFIMGTIMVASIPFIASSIANPNETASSKSSTSSGSVSSSQSASIAPSETPPSSTPAAPVPNNPAQAPKAVPKQPSAQPTAVVTLNTAGTVTSSKLNMRTGPSTSNPIIIVLSRGNRVNVIGRTGDWYQIKLTDGRTGFVSRAYLQLDSQISPQVNTRQQKINTVIATARSLIGTPYVWGGESIQEGGFDCSGLTQYSFKQAGYQLNRVSADQAKQGVAVARANLQVGDLVFFSFSGNGVVNHVGIYTGNGTMINSPKTGDFVKTTDISAEYWQTRFVTARRII